ncbi:MAG TPA: MFS transporter [Terriglobales bacterium]
MATMPAQTARSQKLPHPLKTRNFVLWWTGATLSLLGDQFYVVALPWVVLQLTGSAVAMGMVSMCAGVPRAVLMLMGGAVADRMSARKLMMITAISRALLVGSIGCLLWAGLSRDLAYVFARDRFWNCRRICHALGSGHDAVAGRASAVAGSQFGLAEHRAAGRRRRTKSRWCDYEIPGSGVGVSAGFV